MLKKNFLEIYNVVSLYYDIIFFYKIYINKKWFFFYLVVNYYIDEFL